MVPEARPGGGWGSDLGRNEHPNKPEIRLKQAQNIVKSNQ